MKRLFTLTKVMYKTASSEIIRTKKSKSKQSKLKMALLFGFLFIYLGSFVGFISYLIINTLNSINQGGVSFQLLFLVLNGFIIFTALIAAPTVLYFSKDIQNYLVLPVEPWEILGAKFLTGLLTTYILTIGVFIPFLGVYFYIVGFDIVTLLLSLVTIVLVPIFPTALVMLLIIIIFTFIPFVRNKDLFTYFTMFLTVGLSLTFSLSSKLETMDATTLLQLIQGGNNSILNIIQSPFNPSTQYAKAIINQDIIPLLAGMGISAISVIILGIVAQKLYFKGAIGISETTSKKRSISDKDVKKFGKQQSQTIAFFKQDLRNILRTPILLTNYYFGLIIIPIAMIIPGLIEGRFSDIGTSITGMRSFIAMFEISDLMLYAIIGGFLFGFGLSAFSTLAATSFSREGETMTQFITMPTTFKTLYHAKLLTSIVTIGIFPVIYALIAVYILQPPFVITLVLLFAIIMGSVVSSITTCIFDIFAPKLSWENEQEAVKQNFMSVVAMFTNLGLVGLSVYAFIKLDQNIALVIIGLLILTVTVGCYVLSLKLLNTRFIRKIEDTL